MLHNTKSQHNCSIPFCHYGIALLMEAHLRIPNIRESPAQFENRINPRVYVRRITRSTLYKKAPFC